MNLHMNNTYQEINNQPVSWKETLEKVPAIWKEIEKQINLAENTQFVFVGCGSSYYLSQTAASLFQEATKKQAKAIPASEVFLSDESVLTRDVPVVAFIISRSGTTSESVIAAQFLKENYGNVQTVGVSCYSDKTLTEVTDFAIALDHSKEQSVVMTQSFTNMLLALQIVATMISKKENLLEELHQLPQILTQYIEQMESFGRKLGEDATRDYYVFLGLGKYYGISKEATLKLKEMTQVYCHCYNPLEFRHGPISMITPKSAAVVLSGEQGATYISEVVQDIKKYGANTLTITSRKAQNGNNLWFESTISDWARTVLYMPTLHFIAYYKATSLGLNPDKPRNLTQVVKINRHD